MERRQISLEEEKIVALDLASKLMRISEVTSVLFVGSLVKKVYRKNKSGIDLIVLIEDFCEDSLILNELNLQGYDFYKSDDIYILDKTLISIYIQKYQSYIKYLESIIMSEALPVVVKDWTIGGVCAEVILGDIANAIIVYDKNGSITELSERLKNEYHLGKKFEDSLFCQLKNKMKLTVNQYYENNMILFHIGFWECIELVERIYCHKKAMYNLGFKHISVEKEFLEMFNLANIGNDCISKKTMYSILEEICVKYEIKECLKKKVDVLHEFSGE